MLKERDVQIGSAAAPSACGAPVGRPRGRRPSCRSLAAPLLRLHSRCTRAGMPADKILEPELFLQSGMDVPFLASVPQLVRLLGSGAGAVQLAAADALQTLSAAGGTAEVLQAFIAAGAIPALAAAAAALRCATAARPAAVRTGGCTRRSAAACRRPELRRQQGRRGRRRHRSSG